MSLQLIVDQLHAGYDGSTVVQDVSVHLENGDSLAVLGRNGAGKSTLLSALMGSAQVHSGRIIVGGQDLTRKPGHQRARAGLGWVPQERAVFSTLTVEENLNVVARPGYWNTARIYECFPQLAGRQRHLGGQLSGGEQQLLAIGRALMLNPHVLLLDEPLEGLAPMVADNVLQTLTHLLQEHAMTVIIVEQHPQQILPITKQALILDRGRAVHRASSHALLSDTPVLERWLGVQGDP